MDRNRLTEKRSVGICGLALFAFAVLWLVAAAPAQAVGGSGSAEIRLAQHEKGRSLSGQGVQVLAGAPASRTGRILSLPISSLEPTAAASAGSDGWLRFKRGKRAVAFSGLRFDLAAGTLAGTLGGKEIAVFRIGVPAPAAVDSAAGTISLASGKLRLTGAAAALLRQRLGLERALRRTGVGMLWLGARANPTRVVSPVVSGEAGWGVDAGWRKYVLANMGPGSVGTIETAGGASAQGDLAQPNGYVSFPSAAGSFEKGLFGATDRLVLRTQGSVTFAKPGHCIIEVDLADLVVTLDGGASSVTLDSVYDIDTPEGKACGPRPPVATEDVTFAVLDLSAVAPAYSADGKTVTWAAIPATLTAAGAAAFGTGYPEGEALDPLTVTVRLG